MAIRPLQLFNFSVKEAENDANAQVVAAELQQFFPMYVNKLQPGCNARQSGTPVRGNGREGRNHPGTDRPALLGSRGTGRVAYVPHSSC